MKKSFKPPAVAVIIVNYKTRELLRSCLRSVLDSSSLSELETHILVVDNASQDGSAEMVKAEFSQVQLVPLDENIGFTAANNLALKELGYLATELPNEDIISNASDYIFLLNPDTELVGDALDQLVNFMERTPQAGMCGAHLQYGSGDFQHGAFRFPSLAQIVLDFFPLTNLRGSHRLHNGQINGRYPSHLWQDKQPFEVDFVLGATMMARSSAIQAVGGLDEGFFMYCEEMDWCMRLAQAGWSIHSVPTAHVIHYEGQSSRQVRWPAYVQLWRSRLLFYAKHRAYYPTGYVHYVRWLVRFGIASRHYQANRRFVRGELSEAELAAELEAYDEIRAML